ncbi:hypothetical protein [Clostridium algidicarnis]|uniref:hypothetical protein n=1 Tax=Clostridium algidicarnis TaxID=37659 RepID=UPI003FD8D5FA
MNREDIYYLNLVPTGMRQKLYEVVYIGISAYNGLLQDNPEITKSKFFPNVKTRLLTFVVYRQFEDDMVSKEFPFKVDINQVNNFGYNTLTLTTKKIRISLAKTLNNKSLPNRSKYRIKECKNNFKHGTQLCFSFEEFGTNKYEDAPTYFIIGFGIKNGEVDHLNLLLPDAIMEDPIANIDLKREYCEWIMGAKEESHIERQIIKVKEEAVKLIK